MVTLKTGRLVFLICSVFFGLCAVGSKDNGNTRGNLSTGEFSMAAMIISTVAYVALELISVLERIGTI